ncbi:MAG: pentapeptide repeat-containing protein [Nitrospirota bacterium]|jgi:uncharacterized protein YjbI with pentapeptide repeats
MSCSKAGIPSLSDWCRRHPIVWKDEAGKEYCVFHAPPGKKGCTPEKFRELVVGELRRAAAAGRPCNLSGTVFEGDMPFGSAGELPEVSFSRATFHGKADFSQVSFRRPVYFRGTVFKGATLFPGVSFARGAAFSKASFQGEALFPGAFFSGGTSFFGVQFAEQADFGRTTHQGQADMRGCAFAREVSFSQAAFRDDVDFSRAAFGGRADFSQAAFRGDALFSEVDFRGAADFTRARFRGRAVFEGRRHEEPSEGAVFQSVASFTGVTVDSSLFLQGADLTSCYFMDADLGHMAFRDCLWPRRAGRKALYDEVESLRSRKAGDFRAKARRLSSLYGHLGRKAVEAQMDAGDWRYGKMETRRLAGGPAERALLGLYRLVSGYGERPLQAALVLVFLIVSFAFFLGLGERAFGMEALGDFLRAGKLSALLLSTLQYASFAPDPLVTPVSSAGRYIELGARILIPLQAVFFLLALRNRLS